MPEVIQEKPNRKPQWIALVAAVLLLVGVGSTVVMLKVADSQKKEFESAKSTAQNYDRRGDYSGEGRVLQAYLDSKPPKKYADQLYITMATVYLRAKNYDKAIAYYNLADHVDPKKHAQAVNGLALAYRGKGEKDKAIEYYKELLELTKQGNSSDKKFEIKTIEDEMAQLQEGGK